MAIGAPRWEKRYSRKILATDLFVVLLCVFGAMFIRFGFRIEELQLEPTDQTRFAINYSVMSIIVAAAWLLMLSFFDTRERSVFGTGPSEYKRVIHATFTTFGGLAIIAYILKSPIGRGYLMIALPAGLLLLILTRWIWRKRLHQQRKRGRNSYRTIIIGERNKTQHVAGQIFRDKYAGFDLIGVITEHGIESDLLPGLPVVGRYNDILPIVDSGEIDTVIICGADNLTPDDLRRLGWEFEERKVDLVVAASLTDIAGPRIHMRPVSGLPLIHVAYPEFTGRKYLTKRFFDLSVSLLLLIALAPLLLPLALIVKLDSDGHIIFKQRRVGTRGTSFYMWKFRSMVTDAEDRLDEVSDASDGNGVLFKMKNDPRITSSGRWMRKYSLDELHQLINVLRGDMSLIGPRPPLPKEVEQYEEWVHRRLLVKPGITGLWQVSGRSDLSWEDSIRLDLYYAENWSMTGDLIILWKTVRAVLKPQGAY